MPVAVVPYIFILPDESGMLKFTTTDGIQLCDTSGVVQSTIESGNFFSHYVYNETSGFLYIFEMYACNVWRNTTAFDFTAFSDQGNLFTPYTQGAPMFMVQTSTGRIVFGNMQGMYYTDNLFASKTDSTVPDLVAGDNLRWMIHEGGTNILAMFYGSTSGYFRAFRSTTNGESWVEQTLPAGVQSTEMGYKI